MTIQEIKALKRELEEAMLQAFTDFYRLTGVAVASVALHHDSVTIHLEDL